MSYQNETSNENWRTTNGREYMLWTAINKGADKSTTMIRQKKAYINKFTFTNEQTAIKSGCH